MRLDVLHRTTYRYRQPVMLGPHRMALSARAGHELRVIDATLTCDPVASLREIEDVFGNKITLATFAAPTTSLTVTNRMSVEQSASDWPVFQIATDALTYPFAYSQDEIVDLGAMRQVNPDPQVAAWARSFPLGPVTDTLSLLKDLNAAILGIVSYRVRDEEGTQKPAETLGLRSGSCRDIATLFIAAARELGFGARAVSGYLYDEQAVESGVGATHAWAEVYLPEAGWIAFDPTHARVGGARLIATAVGRRNDQIMPILGSFTGAPGDFLGMEVAVHVSRAA